MEQDSFDVGIIGGGPAGCCCAYFIKQLNPMVNVTIIDTSPLHTILATGNGRCNLTHSEFDFKNLAKNYPRGEKFLYSIFSKFGVKDTLELFDNIGIKTYTQNDGRIFPISNSSKEVKNKFLSKLSNIKFIKENALRVEISENFKIITDMNSYYFNKLVFATGSHKNIDIIKRIGVVLSEFKPSLVGLKTKEDFSHLAGISVQNAYNHQIKEFGDILFTHFGVSAPLIYKISSIKSRENFPYTLTFDFYPNEFDFQDLLNKNPHKAIKNLISEFVPKKFAEHIIKKSGIDINTKCHTINAKQRNSLADNLHNYKITINGTQKDGETVNSGGVNLDKINPKTMGYKDITNLYFCGEILDIDGFCGGFNLQNCWSTAFIAANGICNI